MLCRQQLQQIIFELKAEDHDVNIFCPFVYDIRLLSQEWNDVKIFKFDKLVARSKCNTSNWNLKVEIIKPTLRLKNPECNVTPLKYYTVSQKTTLMLHTMTSMHVNKFGNFWQRCCWESMLSKGHLLFHLSFALPGKTKTPEIVSFQSCCIPCLENKMARWEIIGWCMSEI